MRPETIERIALGVVIVVFMAGALAWAQAHALSPLAYPDFIVGAPAWSASTKSQDTLAPLVVALAAAVAYALFRWSFGKSAMTDPSGGTTAVLLHQVFLWSLPAIIAIAFAVLGNGVEGSLLLVSAAGLAATLACAGRAPASSAEQATLRGLLLFALACISLLPIAAAIPLSRHALLSDSGAATAIEVSRWLFVPSMVLGAFLCTRPALARAALVPALAVGQLSLAAFYLALWPARMLGADGRPGPPGASALLGVMLVALGAWAAFDIARRAVRHRKQGSELTALLSPVAVFGLFVGLRCGATAIPYLGTDDYHIGEWLLGWWSLLEQGAIPYRDYMPARGLIADDLPGLVGRLFHDGTAAGLAEARRVTLALSALVAFLFLERRTRSLALALVATLLFSVVAFNHAWLLLVPFVCVLLVEEWDWRRVAIWSACALALVIGFAQLGMALVAATAPAAAQFALARRAEIRHFPRWVWAVLVAAAVLAVLTPLAIIAFGSLRYVLENGSVNQAAWAIPWSASWIPDNRRSGLVFELVRMSWIAVPLMALAFGAAMWRNPAKRAFLLGIALPIALFCALLVPYAIGRIDPLAVSRTWILSNFAWAAFVPLLLLPFCQGPVRGLLAAAIAIPCAVGQPGVVTRVALDHAAFATVRPPTPLVDGAAAGMPNVGRAVVDAAHWARLLKLKATLDGLLPPGAPYLDLTNRTAQMFYLGRPPVMPIAAPFNMVPVAQQRRAIEVLKSNPPAIALLEAQNTIHDGGGLALRTPLLYRFVVDTYEPELVDGFIIGRLRARAATPAATQPLRVAIQPVNDVNWDRGISRRAPGFVLQDARLAARLAPGTEVVMPDGKVRNVRQAQEGSTAVWLEGAPLEPALFPQQPHVLVSLPAAQREEHRLGLWDQALRINELGRIPIAWGRSWPSLEGMATGQVALAGAPRTLADLAERGGALAVTGGDPRLLIDLSGRGISGRKQGLLGFEFRCEGRAAEPRLQVFWWGDGKPGADEVASVRLTADDGMLVVPLDAAPRWLALGRVDGLRIDLDNPGACSAIRIENAWLAQRAAVVSP